MSYDDKTKQLRANREDYAGKKVKAQVKCPNPSHEDKSPSATLNENNIHCYVCERTFFFNDEKDGKVYNARKGAHERNMNLAKEYNDRLVSHMVSTSDNSAKLYMKKRNITLDTVQNLHLGLSEREGREMITFPIKDMRGDINLFGHGFIDQCRPKYENTNNDDCANIKKRDNLYGIDKIDLDKCKHMIICEGYMDFVSAFQNGFNEEICFVAAMGKSISRDMIPLFIHLKNKGVKISLMLDSDKKGKEATLKIIKSFMGEDGDDLRFEINVIKHEKNSSYKDIDELLQNEEGKERLKGMIDKNCLYFIDYLLEIYECDENLDKEKLNEDIRRYIGLIRIHKMREDYAMKFCQKVDSDSFAKAVFKKDHQYDNVLSCDKNSIRDFLMKPKSYSNVNLPKYFDFTKVLDWAEKNCSDELSEWNAKLADYNCESDDEKRKKKLKKLKCPFEDFKGIDNANYKFFANKDGKHQWRRFELINPILYVALVDVMAENWDSIKTHLKGKKLINDVIECKSTPTIKDVNDESDNLASDTGRQILNWWEEVEQDSIKLSKKYKHILSTDIVDCYGQIYTHSIPWALHGKNEVKRLRNNKSLVGNQIDNLLQCMCYGQTNGIPQGSVVCDIIAEILLKYIDAELYNLCKKDKALFDVKGAKFHIIRYRDDYRIFSNEQNVADMVVKNLSKVLSDVGGLRLSPQKTISSSCVISGSIKADKLDYFANYKHGETIRQEILNIYLFSKLHSNSGSIKRLLGNFKKIYNKHIKSMCVNMVKMESDKVDIHGTVDIDYICSILFEIMYRNPSAISNVCDVVYEVCKMTNDKQRCQLRKEMAVKMSDLPNSEYINLWIERVAHIEPDNAIEWGEFFTYVKNNNGLLYKQYVNKNDEEQDEDKTDESKAGEDKTSVWKFPKSFAECSKNIPKFINDETLEVIRKAENECIQDRNINDKGSTFGSLLPDEADYFYRY